MVILLSLSQQSTPIGDGVQFSILSLEQNHSKTIRRCVCLQHKWYGVVSKLEDWGLEEGLLGLLGQGHFVGLQLGGVTLRMVVQRSCHMSKMCNEASEVSHHPHELPDGHIGVGFREVNDSFYVSRLYPVLGDAMCEICNFITEQVTFGGFEFQMLSPESVKYDSHAIQMVILILRGDHIILVNQAVGEIQLTQAILHQSLECCGHVAQAKRHVLALKETQ